MSTGDFVNIDLLCAGPADPISRFCFHDGKPIYPYIVAVSGHRNFNTNPNNGLPIYTDEQIKTTFKRLLTSLAKKWDKVSGKTAPLILLMGMADGADQIAAEAALELADQYYVKVLAVLPMHESIFINTLDNKPRFQAILEKVDGIIRLPLADENVGKEAELADMNKGNQSSAARRDRQYAILAEFLTLHSHTVFAFWDGIDKPENKGGTSVAVRFKLEGSPADSVLGHSDSLTFPTVGPIVQILIAREYKKSENIENREHPYPLSLTGESTPPVFLWTRENQPPLERSVIKSDQKLKDLDVLADLPEFDVVLPRLGQANRDSVRRYPSIEKDLPQSIKSLGVEIGQYDLETDVLVNHYSVMDQLSQLFQRYTNRISFIYVSALFAFLFLGGILSSFWGVRQNQWGESAKSSFNFLWANGSESPYDCMFCLTVLFWGAFLFLVGLFCFATWKQFHRRYHRYRALAEALRVQIFWRVVGMRNAVSGYYRSHQVDDLVWLRCALNGVDVLLESPEPLSETLANQRLAEASQKWITDEKTGQLSYFKFSIDKRREPWKMDKNINTNWVLKGITFIAINNYWKYSLLGLLTALLFLQPIEDKISEWFFRLGNQSDWMIGVLVAFGIVCSFLTSLILCSLLYVQLRGFDCEADRYKRMIYPFSRADFLLRNTTDKPVEQRYNILRDLGTEALSKNAEWLLSVGERELTLPR